MAGLLVAASPAHAQFGAGVQGTVLDTSGAGVPGATRHHEQGDRGHKRVRASDAGFYRISGLPPGSYRVVASLTGFDDRTVENVEV